MSRFQLGDRVKPANWPAAGPQPLATGGVIWSIIEGSDTGTSVRWDGGEIAHVDEAHLELVMSAADNLASYAEAQRHLKPLPTVPYTVIVVKWRDPSVHAATMFTLSPGGNWASADGVAAEGLDIIDFQVKSQPREVVAAQVLAQVRFGAEGDGKVPLRLLPLIERNFGIV